LQASGIKLNKASQMHLSVADECNAIPYFQNRLE